MIEVQLGLFLIDSGQVLREDAEGGKGWWCSQLSEFALVCQQLNIHTLWQVLHRFAKDSIVYELEKIFLKVIRGLLSFLGIEVEVTLQPCTLRKAQCLVDLCQIHAKVLV